MKALIYGNITLDENITESGVYKGIGGSAYFVAKTLDNLGCTYRLVSPYGSDIPPSDRKKLHLFPATPTLPKTLKFYNIMYKGKRRQKVKNIGGSDNIDPSVIPSKYFAGIDLLIVASVLNNLQLSDFKHLISAIPKDSIVALISQGLFRTIDKNKNVLHTTGDIEKYLPFTDIIFLSQHDTYEAIELAKRWSRGGTIAVITQGKKGCLVVIDGKSTHFPAFKSTKIVDTTGSGDIFAATFAYWLASKEDSTHAALIANAVASLSLSMPKNKLNFTLKALKGVIGR